MNIAAPKPTNLLFTDRAEFAQHTAACLAEPEIATSLNDAQGDHYLNKQLDFTQFHAVADPQPAAVLIGLVERVGELHMLFTRRSEKMNKHSGQVSFAGGKIDPEDADARAAAIREANEEVGLEAQHVELVAQLPDYYSGSGFLISPVIGLIDPAAMLVANPDEVDEIFEVPLSFLMDPANCQTDTKEFNGNSIRYFQYQWRDHLIWGVTAGMVQLFYRKLFA